MKKGFTLAEVLITLAVIGVVAALTIPTVVHKYQQKQMYTQFLKAYNTLSTSLFLAIADHGAPENWTCVDSNEGMQNYIDTYIKPYIKVVSTAPLESVYKGGVQVKGLDGRDFASLTSLFQGGTPDFLLLGDGTVIMPHEINCHNNDEVDIETFVDTNGAKGPNVLGRDMFVMRYGLNFNTGKPGIFSGFDPSNSEEGAAVCCKTEGVCINPEENIPQGLTCVERLLADGDMKY